MVGLSRESARRTTGRQRRIRRHGYAEQTIGTARIRQDPKRLCGPLAVKIPMPVPLRLERKSHEEEESGCPEDSPNDPVCDGGPAKEPDADDGCERRDHGHAVIARSLCDGREER